MAQRQDLVIDQGSRFRWVYQVVGYSLLSLNARMQIRKKTGEPTLLLDVTPYLTVDQVGGYVSIDMPASATVAATWKYGVYDIEVYHPTLSTVSPFRIVQGDVQLDREVTV